MDKIIQLQDIENMLDSGRFDTAKSVIGIEAPDIMKVLKCYLRLQRTRTVDEVITHCNGDNIIKFSKKNIALVISDKKYGTIEMELVKLTSDNKDALLVMYSPAHNTIRAKHEISILLEKFARQFPAFRQNFDSVCKKSGYKCFLRNDYAE